MILFETTRLYVRLFNEKDIEPFHNMESDLEVMKFTSTPYAFSYEENQARLQEVIKAYTSDSFNFCVWAIVRKEDDEVLGSCAISRNAEMDFHEIGYRLRRQFHSMGYISEIVEPLIQYAFENLNLPAIGAYAFSDNIPSVKILDKSSLLFQNEFFNEEYQKMDRLYLLRKG